MNEKSLVALTRASLCSDFDANLALEQLISVCSGDLYIFGGCVRDAALGRPRGGDLDIMVPNGDRRAFNELDRLGLRYILNSQNHRRYFWNRLQIDIFEPKDFFVGFSDVEKAVSYFDLKMNALAVHSATEQLINPVDGLRFLEERNPGINWSRWESAKPVDLAILIIRLTRLFYDIPELILPINDVLRVQEEFLPRLEDIDWKDVQNRFPLGKRRFVELCNELLERKKVVEVLVR
jgi:hypothetical protein